jgi:hypothetical protein
MLFIEYLEEPNNYVNANVNIKINVNINGET